MALVGAFVASIEFAPACSSLALAAERPASTATAAPASSPSAAFAASPSAAPADGDAGRRASGVIEWCANGLEAIAGGGCFLTPPTASKRETPLVVYLHGIYDVSTVGEELDRQRRVSKKAVDRGFSFLALRGEMGGCQRADLAQFYCWPSNERTAAAGPSVVARWQDALREAAARGAGTTQRFVFGFSNGAYFAGLLASRGWFDADAFVIAAGGATEPIQRRERMPPLLLLTADDDPSLGETVRFARRMSNVGWPVDSYSRDGGHVLTDNDIGEAFDFFQRAPHETVPLSPPLGSRRPRTLGAGATREDAISRPRSP